MLRLCEMKEHALLKAYNEGYLPYYCVDIIKSIYNKRDRVKKHVDGQTSVLFMASNNQVILDEEGEFPTELTYDPHSTELLQTAKRLLREDMNSSDRSISNNAQTLYEACYIYKNVWQMSKDSDISHTAIHKRVNKATNNIKKKL